MRRFGGLASAALGEDKTYALSSDEVTVNFTSRGGLLSDAQLSGYKRYKSDEFVHLWNEENSAMTVGFEFNEVNGSLDLSNFHFELEAQRDNSIALVSRSEEGQTIRWEHALDGYTLTSNLTFEGFRSSLGETMVFKWEAEGQPNEKGIDWERQHSSIYYKEVGLGRDYLTDGQSKDLVTEEPLEWLAFKQNFFSAMVRHEGNFLPGATLETVVPDEDSTVTMAYAAALPFEAQRVGTVAASTFEFYLGPNEQRALEELGWDEADRVIDYGWWIFGWVNRNVILPLYDLLASRIASVGIIVLIITLIIKLALSPITWKNFMSSAKMRVLRPEIDEINAKHEDDPMARQQETMALYRKTGVNPLAGCVPALVADAHPVCHVPVLPVQHWYARPILPVGRRSRRIRQRVKPAFLYPLLRRSRQRVHRFDGGEYMFFYMRLTMANQPPQPQQPGMPNMKVIQQFFPFMMLFFFNKFAAGLSLYYLAANVVSMGQMVAHQAVPDRRGQNPRAHRGEQSEAKKEVQFPGTP